MTDDHRHGTLAPPAVWIHHHTMLLLFPGFSFEHGPHDLTAVLLPMHDASLLNHINMCPEVSVTGLAPSIFDTRKLEWWSVTNSLEDGCF